MYRLQKAKLDLKRAENTVLAKEAQRDLLLQQKEAADGRRIGAEEKLGEFDLVQILLQKTSDYARQKAKTRIEEVVTSALTVVFGLSYKFIVKLDVKGNQPVAEYWLELGDVLTQLKPPDYDNGGGIVDVICIGLRLAIGELTSVKGPLLLDEVGKHVSQEYAPNVAYFLKEYSQKFGRQIVLITHSAALAEIGDVSIGVTESNGKSRVSAI